jgi:hypothetical protein
VKAKGRKKNQKLVRIVASVIAFLLAAVMLLSLIAPYI